MVRPSAELEMASTAKAVPAALAARMSRTGTQPTMVPLTEVINALTSSAVGGVGSVPLPVDASQRDPFGPGNPLPIAPIDRPRPDTGRPTPRVTEYQVNENVQLVSDRPMDWKLLRKAARDVDIIRLCMQKRKAHVKPLRWGWVVTEDAVETALQAKQVPKRQRKAATDDVEAELYQKLQPEIARLNAFWAQPWKSNQLSFKQWCSLLLEEYLVLDAVVIYPEFTYGGDLVNFKIIDGSTIKPLRNVKGEIPAPPYPAYQQVLYGFPRGEYTATLVATDEGIVIPGAYLPDQLFYYRDVVRTETPYGMSCVEQALIAARIWLNRQGWLLSEYDDGSGPQMWLVPPADATAALGEQFTPQKRREWQRTYNDDVAGNTQKRKEVQIAPPGFEPKAMPQVDQMYKPDYDMFLIRILASHMGVTMPELNFTEPGGLGSTGYHEGQEDVQERVGTKPATDIIQTIITDLGRKYQNAPAELECKIFGLDSDDEAAQDEVIEDQFESGRITLNEARDAAGKPRYNFPEADMPMLVTPRGVIFLEGSSEQAPAGELVMPAQAPPNSNELAPGEGEPDQDDDQAPESNHPAKPASKPPASGSSGTGRAAKAAELAAYRNWSRKSPTARRPFELEYLTEAEALGNGIDLRKVTFKTAGDGGPKDGAPENGGDPAWPGWQYDLAAAAYWATRIADAVSGAVDAQQLAEDWIAHQETVGAPGPEDAGRLDALTEAAEVWIQAQRDPLTTAVTAVLEEVYTDGYVIGATAAAAVVDQAPIDVGAWVVGDTEAAQLLLGELGDGSGLRTLLTQAGITIRSVVASRLDELGQALAAGAARGDSAETIAASIKGILSNVSRAHMIATTELTRAVSAATAQGYTKRGITDGRWSTADDDRVCPICGANEAEGPVRIGDPYTSGDLYPPGHPWCRCALLPG